MPELIHTCYRVFDLERSVSFYKKLGFEEKWRLSVEGAVNVFMGFPEDGARLQLTQELDRMEPYELGSGYGHIAISSGDIDATLEQLAAEGIRPEKPPYRVFEGGSRLCFISDPDGYQIEIVENGTT